MLAYLQDPAPLEVQRLQIEELSNGLRKRLHSRPGKRIMPIEWQKEHTLEYQTKNDGYR